MHRRRTDLRVVALLALAAQFGASTVAPAADALWGGESSAAHVEEAGTTHDQRAHVHDCVLCRLARAVDGGVPERPQSLTAAAAGQTQAAPLPAHHARVEPYGRVLARAPPLIG